MTFNTALSGIRAADTDLSVTGNNIANASTVGFKTSRAEFADVYANSLISSGIVPGNGVLVSAVAQQFDQGNIAFTDNSLDLAINGQGFFVLNDGGEEVFTRAGNFGLDRDGFLVRNDARLRGFAATPQGIINDGEEVDLRVQTQDLPPAVTQNFALSFNLDSREQSPYLGLATPFPAFNPADPNTFNHSTSQTIFDSQGNPHLITQFFVKQTPPPAPDPLNTGQDNTWDVFVLIDGEQVTDAVNNPTTSTGAAGFQIGFDANGNLISGGNYNITNWVPKDPSTNPLVPNGAAGATIAVDFSDATQFGSDFAVSAVSQDGFAPGLLASVEVSDDGILFARYTNGQALTLGQVILANFANVQGLSPLGNTAWGESFESGPPVTGIPQTSSLGSLQAGALEESNVDLSAELVRLIIAQRNYQANARTIETANTVTQTLINIR